MCAVVQDKPWVEASRHFVSLRKTCLKLIQFVGRPRAGLVGHPLRSFANAMASGASIVHVSFVNKGSSSSSTRQSRCSATRMLRESLELSVRTRFFPSCQWVRIGRARRKCDATRCWEAFPSVHANGVPHLHQKHTLVYGAPPRNALISQQNPQRFAAPNPWRNPKHPVSTAQLPRCGGAPSAPRASCAAQPANPTPH